MQRILAGTEAETGIPWDQATTKALFAWHIIRTFSANEQYFPLTPNQPTVLSAMTYQPSEHGLLAKRTSLQSPELEDYNLLIIHNFTNSHRRQQIYPSPTTQ